MTSTVEYCHRLVDIEGSGDNVELHIIDSAGQEAYLENSKKLWGGAAFTVYVYDVCDENTYGAVETWIREAKAVTGGGPGLLLGNKTDLEKLRRVSPEQGTAMAEKYGLKFFEVSAKTGLNLEEAFGDLAATFHSKYNSAMEAIAAAAEAQ
jgi:GTPase SAR1 family protein